MKVSSPDIDEVREQFHLIQNDINKYMDEYAVSNQNGQAVSCKLNPG